MLRHRLLIVQRGGVHGGDEPHSGGREIDLAKRGHFGFDVAAQNIHGEGVAQLQPEPVAQRERRVDDRVLLGPERLPTVARTLGQWIGRARSTFNHLKNELEREAVTQDMRERMEKQMREMGLDEDSIREARDSLLSPDEVARARRRPETLDQPDNQDNGQTPEAEKKPNE